MRRKRDRVLAATVTLEEHTLGLDLASGHGLSTSDYLRGLLLYALYRERRPEALEFDRPSWLVRLFPEIMDFEKEILKKRLRRKAKRQLELETTVKQR
jgi:hypothetical protein